VVLELGLYAGGHRPGQEFRDIAQGPSPTEDRPLPAVEIGIVPSGRRLVWEPRQRM
jgi:hypothetical protein